MDKIFTSDASITLKQICGLKEKMISEFENSDHIVLDIIDGSVIDLCGLQFIESARRYAILIGKRLSLQRPAEHLRSLLNDAGFLAGGSPEVGSFWFHEEPAQ